eukprot:2563447-Rhodomonas_salina.1
MLLAYNATTGSSIHPGPTLLPVVLRSALLCLYAYGDTGGSTDCVHAPTHMLIPVAILTTCMLLQVMHGTLHLVDLAGRPPFAISLRRTRTEVTYGAMELLVLRSRMAAGSERLSKSNATGTQLKETQAINKSLSSLSDVFVALGSKKGATSYCIGLRRSHTSYGIVLWLVLSSECMCGTDLADGATHLVRDVRYCESV